jgi:hypothetical protein
LSRLIRLQTDRADPVLNQAIWPISGSRLANQRYPVAVPAMDVHPSPASRRDYESFTRSCLPADIDSGGLPALFGLAAPITNMDDREMIDHGACRP